MAEFQEVMKQWGRMLDAHRHGESIAIEASVLADAFKDAKMVEEIIMSWAAENPEPVYPLWGEWLVSIGAAHNEPTGIPFQTADGRIIDPPWEICVDLYKPIPSDIAQKFGIRPKEDQNGNS